MEADRVIKACYRAVVSPSPAHKAVATRFLDAYVEDRVSLGYEEVQVRAAIKAHVTRQLKKGGK